MLVSGLADPGKPNQSVAAEPVEKEHRTLEDPQKAIPVTSGNGEAAGGRERRRFRQGRSH